MRHAPAARGQILVVDDEEDFRTTLVEHMTDLGHTAFGAPNAEAALRLARGRVLDVALVDLKMPGMGGVELLEELKRLDDGIEVIVITGHATVDTAIGAMKRGAYDYLTKPCRLAELEAVTSGALEKKRLRQESERLREQIRRSDTVPELVGDSRAMHRVHEQIARVAPADSTVLLLGESGTGKELAARALHRQSRRAQESFVVLHAGAIPENLVESELFGHARGAFTGATGPRRGVLELADGGTLFIDEIGEMPLAAQAKLLRCLESGEVRPVGAERNIPVDVRFVAATNRDLRAMAASGAFREDLFYRLNVFAISMPPLRERAEDVELLARHYLARAAILGRSRRLLPEAAQALCAYHWPGNVRELHNVLERALILSSGDIGTEHLPPELLGVPAPLGPGADGPRSLALEEVERSHILHVLRLTRGNKVEAARLLELPRRTLYRRLERYGLLGGEPG
jgi:two-component system, NtrC family, response regulator AtoC